MARLFGLLVTIFSLAACSSGVSNSGGGGAGTDTGSTDLIAIMSVAPESFSSDAFASDTDDDGEIDQLVSADFAEVEITVTDPLGKFSNVFQGVTFTSFEVRYIRGSGGAPKLGPRKVAGSLNLTLSNGTDTQSLSIPIVDNVTKKQFREQSSGTPMNYIVEVRAVGRDIATNTRIVVTGSVTIEIGEFVEN